MKTPLIPFFIFGAGDRPKLVYRKGGLADATSGKVLHRFSVDSANIDAAKRTIAMSERFNDGRTTAASCILTISKSLATTVGIRRRRCRGPSP
jgi:hypothetical protein